MKPTMTSPVGGGPREAATHADLDSAAAGLADLSVNPSGSATATVHRLPAGAYVRLDDNLKRSSSLPASIAA